MDSKVSLEDEVVNAIKATVDSKYDIVYLYYEFIGQVGLINIKGGGNCGEI